MLLMDETGPKACMAVLLASDETEPRQLEASSLDPPVEIIGRSNQSIADFIQTPDKLIEDSALLLEIWKGYNEYPTWQKFLENPSQFKGFSIINGLLCCSTESNAHILVIPDMNHKGEGVKGLLIENTHKIVGHYSHPKTLTYI